MLTRDELIRDPVFASALWTFYKIQEWGERKYNELAAGQRDTVRNPAEYRREEYTIAQMMEDVAEWNQMDNQQHMAIGKLIAHNFPMFTAICNEPIYIVFDKSVESGGGHRLGKYKLSTYYRPEWG